MRPSTTHTRLAAALVALGLLAAACGSDAGATSDGGGGGEPSLAIASPADGESVAQPFTLELDASVPIDEPETGEHHVHLCVDGNSCDVEYTLVYADSVEVTDLPPGEHTLEVSLRNADHSDAGPTDSITVSVGGGDGDSGGDGATGSGSGIGGPGY